MPFPAVETIERIVCDHYQIQLHDLHSNSRVRGLAHPRQLCMYLARIVRGDAYSTIASHFKRDHTTVMHACTEVQLRINNDDAFEVEVDAIRAMLAPIDQREIPVLDKGFVRLDACEASDLAAINAARVSFGKRKSSLDDEDIKVLQFLMRNKHTSPFEHGLFRFHIKLPLMVVREWHRHRTWSFNEMSGRYTQLPAEWYLPHRDKVRHQVGRPGAYTFERVKDDGLAQAVIRDIDKHCAAAFQLYHEMLEDGIAKEQARLVLPVNMYTEMYASVDPLNLMRFIGLRNSEHAMFEIREYAKVLEDLALHAMPVSFEAFIAQGRTI